MADKTPPGPTPSGRIAGVIAVIALVLGGYYAVVARTPSPGDAPAPAASNAPAATEDSKPAGSSDAEVAAKAAPAEGEVKEAAAPADTAQKNSDGTATGDASKEASKDASKNAGAADAGAAAGSETAAAGAGTGSGETAETEAASTEAAKSEAAKSEAAKSGAAETEAAPIASAAGEGEKTGAPAAPSFDVVRVEPTGEAVVAGLAEPKATVELLDGSAPIAKGEANERGEWAIVLEKPLATGTHDLSLRTTSPDGKTETLSEQRVAIEVPAPQQGEPLVVLNEPNAPSRVLQMPAESKTADAAPAATPSEPAAAGETKTAAAEPDASAQSAAPAGAETAATATPEAPAPAAGEASGADKQMAKAEPAAPADQAAEAPGAEMNAGAGKAAGDTSGASEMAAKTEPAAMPEPAAEAKTAAAPEASTAEPAVEPKVTVDAVEFEDGTIYVAGSAATGGTIRIYVDGVPVGDATVGEGGRWLLESKHDMKPGQHTVRADQIDKDSGDVVVRAEVPFEQQVDVAVLAPVTTTGGGSAGASGEGAMPGPQNVIIRRGDNLWTISRRLYGRGIRYTTIYEANADQIRNPHWIYPGQIFVLPAGDSRWTN